MKKILIATACALALSTTFAAAQMSQPQGSGMAAPMGGSGMSGQQSMGTNDGMGMRSKGMMMKKKKMTSRRTMRKKRMR